MNTVKRNTRLCLVLLLAGVILFSPILNVEASVKGTSENLQIDVANAVVDNGYFSLPIEESSIENIFRIAYYPGYIDEQKNIFTALGVRVLDIKDWASGKKVRIPLKESLIKLNGVFVFTFRDEYELNKFQIPAYLNDQEITIEVKFDEGNSQGQVVAISNNEGSSVSIKKGDIIKPIYKTVSAQGEIKEITIEKNRIVAGDSLSITTEEFPKEKYAFKIFAQSTGTEGHSFSDVIVARQLTAKNLSGNTMENKANGCWVNQYGEWIYYLYCDNYSFSIYKMKSDGSSKTRLVPGFCFSINIIDDWIYYHGTAESNLYRMKIDGTEKTKLNDDRCQYVNVIGDWIYYFNGADDSKIYKIKTDGTGRTKLNDDESWNPVVDGEWIYYRTYEKNKNNASALNKGSLYKIKTDGTQRTKICDDSAENIHVIGDWIYYNAGGIFKIKTDGTQKTRISDVRAYEIAVKDEWIYYTKKVKGFDNGGPVCKMKLDGTGEVVLYKDQCRFEGITDQWIFYNVMHKCKLAGGGWSYYSVLHKMKLDGTEAGEVGQ